jgi:hypothetical protein
MTSLDVSVLNLANWPRPLDWRAGHQAGCFLGRAGWLITVGRSADHGGRLLPAALWHQVRLAGLPNHARCRRLWPGLVGDVCGPAVQVGAGE